MSTPARYRILVQGTIDPSWSDRLGGLSLEERTEEHCGRTTLLRGEILDQAQLSGILNLLYDLRLPLLRVDCEDIEDASGSER